MTTKKEIEDRRILFVRQLSSKTTDDSLKEYFVSKKCDLIDCQILNLGSENQKFGLVEFRDVKDIDRLMESRHHQIDGKIVTVQRKTPEMKLTSKEVHPVEYLRILDAPQTLSEKDIVDYFEHYGHIEERWRSTEPHKYWIIKYVDYDSVDKALLDKPHQINGCKLTVERDNETATARTETPTNDLRQNPGEAMNVKMHEKQHDMSAPTTVNSIHIQNLPSQMDANDLSAIFRCPLTSIVMKPLSLDDRCFDTECWLIDTDGKRKSHEVADLWNKYQSDGHRIECNMEPITFELCAKFRNDECDRMDSNCDWEHQRCTAQGSCPSFCPFGHPQGSGKNGDMPPTTFSGYQVRIFGFNESMSSENLVKQLSISKSQFKSLRNKEQIALITEICTYRYAKWILDKLKTCVPVGATWRYQIECTIYDRFNRRQSQANVPQIGPINNRDNRRRSQSRRGVARATGESCDRYKPNVEVGLTSTNNKIGGNERECLRGDIASLNRKTTPSLPRPSKTKKNSVETISSDLATRWTCDQNQSTNDSRILHVSEKKYDSRSATIKVYDKNSLDQYKNECEILENLVKQGKLKHEIAHFIECGEAGDRFWIVMERAAGRSLKDFLAVSENRERCDLKKSIQLIQKLLTDIIKPLHEHQIYHENITPDHIMIDWDIGISPILQPQLKLISFSHARMGRSNSEATSFSNRSTKDLSSICIILFWLLTGIDHQQNTASLAEDNNESLKMIEKVIQGVDSSKQEQLKTYLIDTFHRASGCPMYRSWTLIDLELRLEAIQELIATKKIYQTPDAVFDELLSIRGNIGSMKTSLSNIDDRYRVAFEEAARIIQESKQDFIRKSTNVYQWSDGSCVWVDVKHSSTIECRHDDILTYSRQRNRTVDRYSVIISFFGRLNKTNNVMTLSIATTFMGKQLEIPIIYDITDGDYEEHLKKIFPDQIKNLLIALLGEQQNLSASNQRI